MVIRIISALVGIVILIGVLAIPTPLAVVIMCSVLAAVAVYELLHNTGIIKRKWLVIIAMLFAAVEILLFSYHDYLMEYTANIGGMTQLIFPFLRLIVLGIYVSTLLVAALIPAVGVKLESIQYAFILTLYATVGFGSIALLRMTMNIGWWLVVLLFVIAWASDIGAYFVGTFFGKHKMAPTISPQKSWEGFVGGWIISVLFAVLFFILRFHIQNAYGENVFYTLYLFIPIAFVLAPLSVCGDLLASVIKRKSGIKDFGSVMPGHGGVMDRFDSVILIAPVLYLIVSNYYAISNFIAGLIS